MTEAKWEGVSLLECNGHYNRTPDLGGLYVMETHDLAKGQRYYVTFSDYLNAYHMQTTIGTASFLYLNPSIKVLSSTLYNYISNLLYHCTIQSFFDPLYDTIYYKYDSP